MEQNVKNKYTPNAPKEDRKYAAIDLGTNCCRLVIAAPTPTSFRIIETYSKITRLGEGIIKDNELSQSAIKRTISALKICSGVIAEYQPISECRFVATAACRRAKNCQDFIDKAKKETGLDIEIISTQEESRLAVVGCIPLLNRNITRGLIFDIGGGSTEISLARVTNSGKVFIEGYVSLPYGVVTISEAFPKDDMTSLAYDTIIERTHGLLKEFDEKYKITEGIKNNEIQTIGTSGTVTVLGAIHLNLTKYNRSAVDGISISRQDMYKAINKIKSIGDEGRKKHPCIGMQKADLTIAGCAIIEALSSFWPISEITVADRGIREGILLDMMHRSKNKQNYRNKKRKRFFNNRKKRNG
ncbi:MAG: Ppx/GppA family phosphatase [Lactobacillaceae bacterium]|jgi:exopolyphosphatase/guanosine-5'-triphosphate,3'-diphosphate pyrophosphatase|nr:Ppx/GppA family phosphatase [Lactobacillaceae bacterium]